MEFIIILALVLFILIYTKVVDLKGLTNENELLIRTLKEKDYDFYVIVRYDGKQDASQRFNNRIKYAIIVFLLFFFIFIGNLNFINFFAILLLTFITFKMDYIESKKYYKKYMSRIDQVLPYYLKSLEILCQNYTVPVALSRSIDDAPEIFKPGLKEMIKKIDEGDSTIQPYMDFALKYPVRDSMRMMRLLYRLSLGAQENKYQQLLLFSRSVSSLQNKAREQKYKARLNNMEKRTMIMLVVTGGGTMLILLFSMLTFMGI